MSVDIILVSEALIIKISNRESVWGGVRVRVGERILLDQLDYRFRGNGKIPNRTVRQWLGHVGEKGRDVGR